jgi:hypothetical protein
VRPETYAVLMLARAALRARSMDETVRQLVERCAPELRRRLEELAAGLGQ